MWRLLLLGEGVGLMGGSLGGLSGLATQNTPRSTHWALNPTWGSEWKWLRVPAEMGRGPRSLQEKADLRY